MYVTLKYACFEHAVIFVLSFEHVSLSEFSQ